MHTAATEGGFYEGVGNTAVNDRWYRPEDWPIDEHAALPFSYYKRLAVLSPSHFLNGEALGELIACFAATSIVFHSYDHEYSLQLLKHAEELYEISVANPYRTLHPTGVGFGSPSDETAWARIWLFRATNQTKYLVEAEDLVKKHKVEPIQSFYRTGSRAFAVQILLAKLTKQKRYINQVKEIYNYFLTVPIRLFDHSYCTQCAANLAFVFLQV